MFLSKINNDVFYTSFFENNKVSKVFSNIYFKKETLFNNEQPVKLKKVCSIALVPNYLKVETKSKFNKVFQKTGFAVDLSTVNSVEQYKMEYCKRDFRNNIKKRISRLEGCFEIQYKMYYGNISNEEHSSLMEHMHTMLKERFTQRKDNNPVLNNWDYYLENSFRAINNNQASLFVIYDDASPIALSLNYLQKPIYYFAIPTFNLDYSKFSLGNVLIHKQLEWCLKNDYTFFDIGYGDLFYKRQWCNTSYSFEHYVLWEKQRISPWVITWGLNTKYKIINYLIDKKINKYYNHLKGFLGGNTNEEEQESNHYTLKTIGGNFNLELQDLKENDFRKLKKPVNDFLYLNQESIGDIEMFNISNQQSTFLIKGKSNQVIVKFTQHNN